MNGRRRIIARIGPALLVAIVLAVVPPGSVRADDLKDGRNALLAGRLDDAQASFEKAAAQGSAEGRAGVGQVWLKRRHYASAMEAFQQAAKMDPNLAMAYYGQADVLRRQGQCDRAVALFRKATDLDRKFPEAQLGLGECLVQIRQHSQAVDALNEGLKWGPKWRPRFLVALGNAEMARDSLRDAGIYFTRAREEAPEDAAPHQALGNFYLKRGIPALAVPEFQSALRADSTDVELHYQLGQALYFDKRYTDALQEYRWAVSRDPEFAPAQLALGNLFYLSGPADPKRYAEARVNLEKYTQLEPGDARGWSLLGRTLYFLRMPEAAIASLQRADSLGDKSKEAFTLLGRAYVEQREWDKALQAYAKGEPDISDQLRIGQVYVIRDQPAAAESLYNGIIERNPSSRDARFALNELGKMKFRLQDYPAAVELLKRRIALDPGNGEPYYFLGLAYKELKQYPEALEALRQAAALEPERADRHFWVGILYAQLDSIPQARAALERSVEIDSTGGFAAVALRQLGFYYLLDKQYDEAIELLQKSLEINDKDVQAWVWLAQGYQNSGNRRRAIENYDRALQLDPRQPDALRGKKSLEGGGR
ncbi:MAG: hypothetical protein A2W00_06655 [Candidatus Eisenbacteria bacterium RBG_16_71_46]|nr:MAG: hypothetical protein A2W00_06655 [Candidatus Eisenbacteria bacterium RBG_16_71_46]